MEEVKNNDWIKGSYDNVIFNMFSIIEDIATNDKKINEGDYLILANAFKRLNELRSELKNNNHYQSIENNRLRQVERVRNGLQEFRMANRINSNLKISCDKCNSTFSNKYILNKHKKNAKKCLEISSAILYAVASNECNEYLDYDKRYKKRINGNKIVNKDKLLLEVVEKQLNTENKYFSTFGERQKELSIRQKTFIKEMIIVSEMLKEKQNENQYKSLYLIINPNDIRKYKVVIKNSCINNVIIKKFEWKMID